MMIHTVQSGETLYSIASAYGLAADRIRSDNGLPEGMPLVVGQALLLLFPGKTHTVETGDTLYSVARRYGVTLWELLQMNPTLSLASPLYVGQTLTVAWQEEKRRSMFTGGYAYPYINKELLRQTLPYLSALWIFSYGFTERGTLLPPEDGELLRLARSYDTLPLLVLTTVDETGGFSSERAERLLGDAALRQTLLQNLLAVMQEKGYGGLDVDFEYVPPAQKAEYEAFLLRCRDACHSRGLLFTTVAAPKSYAAQPGLLYEAHDYPALGEAADRLFLMTYEWGYTYGPPMAVAPLPQVRQVAEYAVTEVPPRKLVLGIPNYGYDWRLPYQPGTAAESIGNEQAVEMAAAHRTEIRFDETAASPYFYYADDRGDHVVWFEDVRSIEKKLALADSLSLGGVGYWNLMRPFRANRLLLASRYRIEKTEN